MSDNPQLLDFAIWLMHHSQHFLYLHQPKTFPKLLHILRKFTSLRANFAQDSVGQKVNLSLFWKPSWKGLGTTTRYMLLQYNPLITTCLLFFYAM